MQQADYVGWNGGAIGPKGRDESVLAGCELVDDPLGANDAAPTIDEDGEVCLHSEIEAYEDEPSRSCVKVGNARAGCGRCRSDSGFVISARPIVYFFFGAKATQ